MTTTQRYLTLGLAVLFAIVCVLPNVWFAWDPATRGHHMAFLETDAELHYAARVQEVMEGSWRASNVYYAGSDDVPYFFAPLPEMTIALIGRMAGLNAPDAITATRALFGGALWFLFTAFLTYWSRRWALSLLSVAALMLAGPLFPWPQMLVNVVLNTSGSLDFLAYSRPIHPQFSSLLFVGALWGLLAWRRTRARWPLAITAVCTIASFYTYVFVWTFLGVVYAIVAARVMIQRDTRAMRDGAWFALIVVAGLLPYAWNVVQATHHSWYAETARRHGMIATHEPVLSITALLLLALAIATQKRFGADAWLSWALGIAGIVVLNQQVITGQSLASPHYHWYFIRPLLIIMLVLTIGGWVEDLFTRRWPRSPRAFGWIVGGCVIAAFAFGALFQWRSYHSHLASARSWLAMEPALAYVRDHARKGEVVYAPDLFRGFTAVYTSADAYWANDAGLYLSSDERSRDAYFMDLWMNGVTADQAERELLTTRRAELASRISAIYYREATGSYEGMPAALVREHVAAYRVFLAQSEDARISAYPLHYAVLPSGMAITDGTRALTRRGTRVFSSDSYDVFAISGASALD
jgi:hypothetical protein